MERLLQPVASGDLALLIPPRSVAIGNKALGLIPPPRFHKMAYRWASMHRPERLYSNLRPGPALFFCHLAAMHGWPLVAVIWPGQFDAAPPEFRDWQDDAMAYAEEVVRADSVPERDALTRGLAPELTLAELRLR